MMTDKPSFVFSRLLYWIGTSRLQVMENKIMFLFFWHQVAAFDNKFYQILEAKYYEGILRISPTKNKKKNTT